MERRQVLGALCSSVVLGAGYTDTVPPVAKEPFRFDPAVDEPFAKLRVGDRQNVDQPEKYGPHTVDIWNAGQKRRLSIQIDGHWRENRWTVERQFPTYQYLQIELLEPDEYRISVGERDGRRRTVPVESLWFDCNISGTIIRVGSNGQLTYSGGGTLALCDSWSPNRIGEDDTLIRSSRR